MKFVPVLISLLALYCCESEEERSLYPDKLRHADTLDDRQSVVYKLHSLLPNSHYEVRVSYPATIPAEFTFEILEPLQPQQQVPLSRDLLNTEKIMFTTDEHVLETLLYGAPYDVVKLGIFVSIAFVLLATIVIPQVFPYLPGFKKLVD